MRIISLSITILLLFVACSQEKNNSRETIDFNKNWKFELVEDAKASSLSYDDSEWRVLDVPHDWSIEKGYNKEKGAASTGFVEGGMGWYRKHFSLSGQDKDKVIEVLFDGVYNNSSVWINGHFLGKRPYGYSSFSYNLTDYLNYDGSENILAVQVDRKAFIDSRWYTGSGIYRNVHLIKKNKMHIKQWGVQITIPVVSKDRAELAVVTNLSEAVGINSSDVLVKYSVFDADDNVVTTTEQKAEGKSKLSNTLLIENPRLWGVDSPNLYRLKVELLKSGEQVDVASEVFGIRTFNFDANKGFSLNGENMKIKGVNLHHDGGAVGAAVPKAIWEYRIDKLKSIGVNAVRMSHNPHSTELMEVCDEKGILVMAEAFDEWYNPKKKSLNYLGDNAASKEDSKSYPSVFNEWAERDLKDLILRDFNHPSVFMWSIGNEIEWTFPYYAKSYAEINKKSGAQGYQQVPDYNAAHINKIFTQHFEGEDPLAKTAKQLVKWVKEVDTTRPTTCGSVLPSIGMASGYGTAVDVYGFNYRASEYDRAHKVYPDLKILGTENWGAYSEWKACIERDFVSGIFAWTGFAYLGEAGPWPRKGLEISFFDYAGLKTPRGHFYECLWKKDPKVYMVTTPAEESEFSFSEKEGWKFDMQYTPAPVWKMLRKWEWYKVYPKWNYGAKEPIIVQAYTNCEEAELFLNGKSLGKQKLSNFKETDNILKWLVPYTKGKLKVVGYDKGVIVDSYELNSQGKLTSIDIKTNKSSLKADGYDAAVIEINLLDEKGELITDKDQEVTFNHGDLLKTIGVDNGWEKYVGSHQGNVVKTHQGKAVLIIQTKTEQGIDAISASVLGISSENLKLHIE